jgi:Fe-S cluster assembly iron-binding protein IscA
VIEVTDRAKDELKRLLVASVDWPGARLRLLDRGQGKLGLGIDIEKKDDRVVEYEGEVLLIVEAGLASRLNGVAIDVDNTPAGVELVVCELA